MGEPPRRVNVRGRDRILYERKRCGRGYLLWRWRVMPVTKDPADPEFPHGTLAGYKRRCSCDPCREASAAYASAWRSANPEKARATRAKRRSQENEAARAWRLKNLERSRASSRAWNAAHPEVIRAANARVRAKPEYQEKARQMSRAWYAKNVERAAEYAAAWARAHPEQIRLRTERRRALKRAADTRFVSTKEWLRLIARYDGVCAYCGEKRSLTQDHIIPLCRGGRHAIGNLLPACQRCNSSKNARLLIEWWPEYRVLMARGVRS